MHDKSYKQNNISNPMKKWAIVTALLLALPLALADIGSTLRNIFHRVISIGDLSFLGLTNQTVLTALVRVLIWIIIFTIFFAVLNTNNALSFLGEGKGRKGKSLVISASLATIATVFMPASLLLATGAGWSTVISFIMIGGPVVAVAYLLWKIPGKGQPETRGTIFLKLVLCIFLYLILSAIRVHMGRI